MKRIAILGAGGQAREIEWLIRDINRSNSTFEFLGYVVGTLSKLSEHDSHDHLLGDESWLESNWRQIDCLAIGIGSPAIRYQIGKTLPARFPELEWPNLIHPQAVVDKQTCEIQQGVLICAGATCTTNIRFSRFALVNFGCTVGHDASIGVGCVINPGANISGGVVLEDGVLVGTGAQVLQYRRVGARSIVGAGSVVVSDVPADTTVVGIPAKELRDKRLEQPNERKEMNR